MVNMAGSRDYTDSLTRSKRCWAPATSHRDRVAYKQGAPFLLNSIINLINITIRQRTWLGGQICQLISCVFGGVFEWADVWPVRAV